MFDWFYERVGRAVTGQIEVWLQDPENIEEITKLTDALVDRQMQRIYGSLSQLKAPTTSAAGTGGLDLSKMITAKGGISGKKLMTWGIQQFLKGKMGENKSTSSLP